MQTIVLATQKGGSGKSTIAIALALAAQEAGHTVRVIETDQQGTLSNWQRRRGSARPLVEAVYNAREIESRLQSLALAGVTLAIIDTSGGITAATTEAVRYCDLCMIPARPSIVDIEASAATIELVRAWRKPFAFILNQTPTRSQRNSGAADAIGEAAARDLDDVLARPFIVMRNDHQDALAAGLAVSELSPFGKSADEIRDLWRWVEMRMNGAVASSEVVGDEMSDVEFPIILSPEHIKTTAVAETVSQPRQVASRRPARGAGLQR
jgi:chromosome partitioning protein